MPSGSRPFERYRSPTVTSRLLSPSSTPSQSRSPSPSPLPPSPIQGKFLRSSSPQSSVGSCVRSQSWLTVFAQDASPYSFGSPGHPRGLQNPFVSSNPSLSPGPFTWISNSLSNRPEPDDELHEPDPVRDRLQLMTIRGFTNLGCLAVLAVAAVGLFVGYPLAANIMKPRLSNLGGFNVGGINSTGQIPSMNGNWGLIDLDTPNDVYTKLSYTDRTEMQLVFSDEFNVEGRTFYPGDDPYWEAADLHYWQTNNMEWYDPSAVVTKNGALEITLSRTENHDLHFMGGLVSTWNKFCFTGGLVEASVVLPGASNVMGLWPAIWAMGNLGRAGYGASLEGMWPYVYDACDVGTLPNQTIGGLPLAATVSGDTEHGGILSFLPGQRLSRCTCPGESHPGPIHADGTYVGRAAPEIDMFEAQVGGRPRQGEVSQSAQWAPFNAGYVWFNTSNNVDIADTSKTKFNSYLGGVFQQATSAVTLTNQNCYQLGTGCFSTYGFEYKPGFDNAYITWISDGTLAWTLGQGGLAADSAVEISARPVPQEPMHLIANLGMSSSFGDVDLDHLRFPSIMRVDWIRVYQPKGQQPNIGCDPKDFPTAAYIKQYIEAYTNPNLTTWRDDYKQPFPRNRLLEPC